MVTQYDTLIMEVLNRLGAEFPKLNWNFSPDHRYGTGELVSHWLGEDDEDVMVCVYKGKHLNEQFHRQDFFFLHFALHGDYETLSAKYNDRTLVSEGDCYIGQPYSGYAAKLESAEDGIIIGILIRQNTFVQEFLPSFSSDTAMLNFFLEPHKNKYSDEFVHLTIPATSPVWRLLGLMCLEYADKTSDSQKILKPLVMSLCMYISSEYKKQRLPVKLTLAEQMIEFIDMNSDSVTLQSLATHFGYHPVYVSKFLPKKTGKSFSQLLTEARMTRAKLLLSHTDLSIEKIAGLLGYSNSSNFYKNFRQYYGVSPRQT